MDVDNKTVESDVFCSNETDSNDCTLFFQAEINNNAFACFKIAKNEDAKILPNIIHGEKIEFQTKNYQNSDSFKTYIFDNKFIKIFENLHQLVYNDGVKNHFFRFDYMFYPSYNDGHFQPSGAYIFRPMDEYINNSIPYTSVKYAKVFLGRNLIQITVKSNYI